MLERDLQFCKCIVEQPENRVNKITCVLPLILLCLKDQTLLELVFFFSSDNLFVPLQTLLFFTQDTYSVHLTSEPFCSLQYCDDRAIRHVAQTRQFSYPQLIILIGCVSSRIAGVRHRALFPGATKSFDLYYLIFSYGLFAIALWNMVNSGPRRVWKDNWVPDIRGVLGF